MTRRFSAAARNEMLSKLGTEQFDMLVIGGGITGAGIARDAAMRGFKVALVERLDFGSGTSSRSSRLIHGGLRYLEHGYFHLVFESSRERRALSRIAPHLVRPLSFIWPVYENARVPGWKLSAGLILYDALSLFRNLGGNHQRLSVAELAQLEPALRTQGLTGGARYHDAGTDDIRLTLANARAAAEAGAIVANHAAVRKLTLDRGAVAGAIAHDSVRGQTIGISARIVVNATGPWTDAIRRLADPRAPVSLRVTKGVHVAVARDRIGNRGALTLLSPIDGRVMFILPAGQFTIIGTTDTDYSGPIDLVRASHSDAAYLLRSANAYFPEAHLVAADIVAAWAGIRPLVGGGGNGDPASASREHSIVWTVPRLLTVSGGKLTTYRSMAAEVVDTVAASLDKEPRRAATDRVPLPGGDFRAFDGEIATARSTIGVGAVADHLVRSYGSEWRSVWTIVGSNTALAAPVAPTLPYIVAELHHAVQSEMAMTLGDLLIRRTHVAFEMRDHGISAAPAVSRVVSPLLEWHVDDIPAHLARYREEVAGIFELDGEEQGVGSRQ